MPNKVRVSRVALIARINRKLVREGKRLYASRSERASSDLGGFYILDMRRNSIAAGHVDPVELAREIGVLRPFEEAEGF
jgi:hypothetical protein